MVKRSIETTIRVNVFLIYLLVALVCGGVFFYFYISSRDIDLKKKSVEEYDQELTQISELIHAVNEAQADVNLFIITENKKHLRQYQERTKEIGLEIDSLKAIQQELGIDTILAEVTQLLKRKEHSIILLNKQFTGRNPIDSLSQKLTTLSGSQQEVTDTFATTLLSQELPVKRGLWEKLSGLFSPSRKETPLQTDTIIPASADTALAAGSDTLEIDQIIEQARENYDLHISAIEKQISSVVMADQYISTRITELLTMLFDKVVHSHISEINQSKAMLQKNNIRAFIFGGIALLLILVFVILILRNVNKGHSARKALEQANKRTRQLMESRHQLLLSVSHDVKTPLNSMLGYIDLYNREGILTTEEITPIHNSGNHILLLLSNLLEFSSLEKGSVMLAPRNFLPEELCSELCGMFIPLAKKKTLDFDYKQDFPPSLTIHSDSLKIKQILINILSNAVKYTVKGGVTFEAAYRADALEFRITDTGAGVPDDKMEMLYKPFSRIEENSVLEEGSGFGLFVVKGLVDLLKGEIAFRSKQGKGTQVIVKLPVTAGENQPVATSSRKMLLLEDDEIFLDLLAGLCRQLGHTVVTCKNRREFTQQLVHINSFDCVLTDMEMENFTGKDVLREVREKNKDIPVILLTGRTDLTMGTLLSEGFTDYISKPVTLSTLHALVGGRMVEKEEDPLAGFFGQDKKAVAETMERFLMSTILQITRLRESITHKDFEKAQYLCHKIAPMFMQIGAPEQIIRTMKHIDGLRGEEKPGEEVWQQISMLTDEIELFLQDIREKYLPD